MYLCDVNAILSLLNYVFTLYLFVCSSASFQKTPFYVVPTQFHEDLGTYD